MSVKERWVPVVNFPAGTIPIFSTLRAVPLTEGRIQLQRLEKVEQWKDITDQCFTSLIKSKASSGYYVAIQINECDAQGNKTIGRLGFPLADGRCLVMNGGYKAEKVPDGTISFRVFKRMF